MSRVVIVGVGSIGLHQHPSFIKLLGELAELGVRTEVLEENESAQEEVLDETAREIVLGLCGSPIGLAEIETFDYRPSEFDVSYADEKSYRKEQYLHQLKHERLRTRALFKRYRGVK